MKIVLSLPTGVSSRRKQGSDDDDGKLNGNEINEKHKKRRKQDKN